MNKKISNGKYLPYSAKRYFITPDGDVLNQESKSIVSKGSDTIQLDWVLGRCEYDIGMLVLIAFKKFELPMHYWDRIVPLYIDNDSTNKHIKNITYKFNEPIEADNYPGFYYIPFSTGYIISKDGDIINHVSGKKKIWSISPPVKKRNSKRGYNYTRIISDDNKTRLLFKHRALCYTFKEYDNNVHNRVVNHIDGVPGNNSLENIEWSTHKENAEHALANGLRARIKPVLMRDIETNVVTTFQSAAKCGYSLGYSDGDPITTAIAKKKIMREKYIFKYDDGNEWFSDDEISLGDGADIVARNVFTGNFIVFNGTVVGAARTGVSISSIDYHLKQGKNIPVNGWNFRYLKDHRPFPKHTEKHLEMYKKNPQRTPNGIVLTHIDTGEEIFYTSVREASEALKISEKSLYLYAKNNKIYDEKFKVEIFYVNDNLGPPTE